MATGQQQLPAELSDREIIELLFRRVSELERFLLTFRNTQLTMSRASEDFLGLNHTRPSRREKQQ